MYQLVLSLPVVSYVHTGNQTPPPNTHTFPGIGVCVCVGGGGG